ncbi:hypothetical protein [Kribbella sp. CA-294648]|uniref:hypothetical protein n=1 Tax=Kribbella sp. CA-294648 TaxID=3239948 RepID=UPI003D8A0925
MSEAPDGERIDQFIVFAAYGEVMLGFQLMELSLWSLNAINLKPAIQAQQATAKVEKWNGTTFGDLLRGLRTQPHWPPDLLDQLDGALDARNYLAHHFLREHFVLKPSLDTRDRATAQLAEIARRQEKLQSELDTHLRSVGVPDVDKLDDDLLEDLDTLRPTSWSAEEDT